MKLNEYLLFRIKFLIKKILLLKEFYSLIFFINCLLTIIINPLLVLIIFLIQVIAFRKVKSILVCALAIIIALVFFFFVEKFFNNELENMNFSSEISGTIIEPPNHNEYNSSFILNIPELKGNIYVISRKNEELSQGDRIRIENNIVKTDLNEPFYEYLYSKKVWYESKSLNSLEVIEKNRNVFILLKKFNQYF